MDDWRNGLRREGTKDSKIGNLKNKNRLVQYEQRTQGKTLTILVIEQIISLPHQSQDLQDEYMFSS